MQYKFSAISVVLWFITICCASGQSVTFDELFKAEVSDSAAMKYLFSGSQFRLAKTTKIGTAITYQYEFDSINMVYLDVVRLKDTIWQIKQVVYKFNDKQAYKQIGKALRKEGFELKNEYYMSKPFWHHAKTYRGSNVFIILAENDKGVKPLFMLQIQSHIFYTY